MASGIEDSSGRHDENVLPVENFAFLRRIREGGGVPADDFLLQQHPHHLGRVPALGPGGRERCRRRPCADTAAAYGCRSWPARRGGGGGAELLFMRPSGPIRRCRAREEWVRRPPPQVRAVRRRPGGRGSRRDPRRRTGPPRPRPMPDRPVRRLGTWANSTALAILRRILGLLRRRRRSASGVRPHRGRGSAGGVWAGAVPIRRFR